MKKMYSFKKGFLALFTSCLIFNLFSFQVTAAELTATANNGDFKTASTWGNNTPQSGDVLIIPAGITVKVNNTPYLANDPRPVFHIKIYGTLDFSDPGNTKLYLANGSIIDIYSGGKISTTSNSSEIIAIYNGTSDNTVWTGSPTTLNGPKHATAFTNGFSDGVLPVKLIHFSASYSQSGVLLKWSTATETNNRGFEVERKSQGNNFETIAFIASQSKTGNSDNRLDYEFTDATPFSGSVQYRLKQIDLDGKITYSDIRNIEGAKNKSGISVFPNPSKNGSANLAFGSIDSRSIKVLDLNGRIIRQYANLNATDLKITGLGKGSFIITVKNNVTNQVETLRLVVAQ